MSVKIRLTRMGKKKQPTYRVVVMDSRKPRDGAYLEQIGRYDPRQDPSIIEIDNERAVDWLRKGAQPTERARKLLEISGAWTSFRVSRGDIHTVPEEEVTDTEAAPAEPEKPAHTPEVHVVGGPLTDETEAEAPSDEPAEIAASEEPTAAASEVEPSASSDSDNGEEDS